MPVGDVRSKSLRPVLPHRTVRSVRRDHEIRAGHVVVRDGLVEPEVNANLQRAALKDRQQRSPSCGQRLPFPPLPADLLTAQVNPLTRGVVEAGAAQLGDGARINLFQWLKRLGTQYDSEAIGRAGS